MTTITGPIQLAHKSAAEWTAQNPVLLAGQIGYETDTLKAKLGNGSTPWNGLDYTASSGEVAGAIDGGKPNSNYGATTPVTGGKP